LFSRESVLLVQFSIALNEEIIAHFVEIVPSGQLRLPAFDEVENLVSRWI
jgi:hypothetical protein